LVIRWKDVVSLTKEKTALVIPNAIQVHTAKDKHFFTSFVARDKTFLMLHRLWQAELNEQVRGLFIVYYLMKIIQILILHLNFLACTVLHFGK